MKTGAIAWLRAVAYLRTRRGTDGGKPVPVGELVFEMDDRLFFLARAHTLFLRAMAEGLHRLCQKDGLTKLEYLRHDAVDALESIRKHPLLDEHGWKCSLPHRTNRAWLHEHHLRFRSRGGTNARENREGVHMKVRGRTIVTEQRAPAFVPRIHGRMFTRWAVTRTPGNGMMESSSSATGVSP